jgi:glycopeptide antibiotics resistance protein
MHFTGMMVHACVCAWTASCWNRSLQTAWILSLMFGFVLEILQGVLDWGRTFDVTDMAANGFGVAAAFLLARAIEHRRAIQQ